MAPKVRGQSMSPEKVQQIQQLRRSSAASARMVRTTRAAEKRRAIRESE